MRPATVTIGRTRYTVRERGPALPHIARMTGAAEMLLLEGPRGGAVWLMVYINGRARAWRPLATKSRDVFNGLASEVGGL